MVAATRPLICFAIALASAACGVVLPAPEDADSTEPGTKDPVTTKGANLPAPGGSEGEAGAGTAGAGPDGSSPASPKVYRVFVTSRIWASDDIGGLSGADAKCSTLASTAPELQGKRWAAWLSAGTSAVARLGTTPGPWARLDGINVASNRAQLVDRLLPLYASISVDEQGSLHDDRVWTGTLADGGLTANATCSGWNGASGHGVFGRIDFVKPDWTQAGDVECDGGGGDSVGWSVWPRNRLYCFEID
jgi:hypothetical protein